MAEGLSGEDRGTLECIRQVVLEIPQIRYPTDPSATLGSQARPNSPVSICFTSRLLMLGTPKSRQSSQPQVTEGSNTAQHHHHHHPAAPAPPSSTASAARLAGQQQQQQVTMDPQLVQGKVRNLYQTFLTSEYND